MLRLPYSMLQTAANDDNNDDDDVDDDWEMTDPQPDQIIRQCKPLFGKKQYSAQYKT